MRWENKGHQLDALGHEMASRKSITFYGMNANTIEIYKKIAFLSCEIKFCDSRLAGQTIGEDLIYAFDEILPQLIEKRGILVITANDGEEEQQLRKRLVLKGLRENEDFFAGNTFAKIFLPIFAYYSYGKCYVDYVNHIPNYACTLRCEKCSASIPYLNQRNPSVEKIKQEIDLFFSKVDFCYTYDCTGGEIFILSDQLVEILSYLLRCYPERVGEIALTTNATVLPTTKMLQFMKEHKDIMRITISLYPTVPGWEEKYLRFVETLRNWEIPWNEVGASSWIDFGFRTTCLEKSDYEMEAYFDECGNFCRVYSDGKIYYCVHGHLAKQAFYQEENDDEETLDFTDEKLTARMIIEYNLGYVSKGYLGICRHCQGWGIRNQCLIPVAKQIEDK